jgi:hypothetical protein
MKQTLVLIMSKKHLSKKPKEITKNTNNKGFGIQFLAYPKENKYVYAYI